MNQDLIKDFDISARVVSLKELLYERQNYEIPGYQRPYEWSGEHIKKAFETVKTCLGEKSRCVFGTIQLNISDGISEIIDGQQRLTTFALLLRALGKKPVFAPQNRINEAYEKAFATADSNPAESVYRRNFLQLAELAEACESKEDLTRFLLSDSMCFVLVETQIPPANVEKTLRIFDALNTTGLPLDRKDIFKIRFRDKVQEDGTGDEAFSAINEAYRAVHRFDEGSMYNIDENDLIDTFRFWIIAIAEDNISGNKMKQSANDFF